MAQYKCVRCQKVFEVGPKDEIPECCKGSQFVHKVVAKQSVTYNHELKAAEYGYTKDTTNAVRNGYVGTGSHKPASNSCYINGKYAISPDGSTHSSGRACWKGFKETGTGWRYLGSFNETLDQVDRGGGTLEETLPKT